ncbi:MAG: TIGR03087 family PEP-CTERM/XrtA system glycosyltransferase [Spirochaetes bacterium]|nr:TIGR03087 family PEP-CTERM/XrtA system glycosyltransferase [Spirochaetota bacterium]
MRIAFLAQRVPYPPDRGDKITTFHEVVHLSRYDDVEVFCLADGIEDLENVAPLNQHASAVIAVPVSGMKARARCLAALATNKPLTVAFFDEPRLHQALIARHARAPFDAAVVYSSSMAQYVEGCHDLFRVMQFADLDSLKWGQYASRSRFPLSALYRREAHLLLEYERRIARMFNHSLVCTSVEKADFVRLIPDAPVTCVPNGVDIDHFRCDPAVVKTRARLAFAGVMDYRPNVDAVVWFVREILPLIRDAVPDASFTICGARPSRSVTELANVPGVFVTGRVPDTRPVMQAAEVSVIPLRMARGIQNKLLESMAMSLPCVTTPAVARALVGDAQGAVLVAESPVEFAGHVVTLLRDRSLRKTFGDKARAAVEGSYRWDVPLSRLSQLIQAGVAGRRKLSP